MTEEELEKDKDKKYKEYRKDFKIMSLRMYERNNTFIDASISIASFILIIFLFNTITIINNTMLFFSIILFTSLILFVATIYLHIYGLIVAKECCDNLLSEDKKIIDN